MSWLYDCFIMVGWQARFVLGQQQMTDKQVGRQAVRGQVGKLKWAPHHRGCRLEPARLPQQSPAPAERWQQTQEFLTAASGNELPHWCRLTHWARGILECCTSIPVRNRVEPQRYNQGVSNPHFKISRKPGWSQHPFSPCCQTCKEPETAKCYQTFRFQIQVLCNQDFSFWRWTNTHLSKGDQAGKLGWRNCHEERTHMLLRSSYCQVSQQQH